jgi:lysophospholipase L1-like esterase
MEVKGLLLSIATLIGLANAACQAAWGQCGGSTFNGDNCCVSGYYCKYYNQWFSQCIPGTTTTTSRVRTAGAATTTIRRTTTTQASTQTQNQAAVKPNTIFIAGDSTADEYGANNGKTNGWGKYFRDYVTCNVNNQAKSGQSARTFWRDGRWNSLIAGVSRNDYVFIQFGHNDVGGPHNASEKGAAGGEGDETVTVTRSNGQQEVVHTFPWYIRQMCNQVIAKGAKPVLLSYTPNFSFTDGKVGEGSRFQGYMKLVADEMKIPYIDLYSLIARKWEELGENYIKSNNWFPTDYKHTSPVAADFNAQMVVTGIKCVKIQDLIAVLNNKGNAVNNQCKY